MDLEQTGAPEMDGVSPWWVTSIVACFVIALGVALWAAVMTIEATRPVGEGELLVSDAREAAETFAATTDDPSTAVRRIRTELEIEAVAVLSPDGSIEASSSPLTRSVPGVLVNALDRGVFSAIAAPILEPLSIDGVEMWEAGDVLYQAMQPLEDGGAVVLYYDIGELLSRRAAATSPPAIAQTLELVAVLLAIGGAVLLAARSSAVRRHREVELEATHQRERADDLAVHNIELEMARAETERALELAEEKNRIRAEFVLMINHELRTPLTGVVTGAQLLADDERIPEDSKALLEDVLADGARLNRLIAQMLAVARVENRGLTANPEQQPLSDVIDRLRTAHRSAAVSVGDGVDRAAVVSTDQTTLANLTASLVDNAHTHGATSTRILISDSFAPHPHLVVGDVPPSAIHVIVADNGPGIDRDFLPRAFEKFEKQSFSSGTGLGLYMARMMAESIGASLSVITGTKGTAIAISLPMERSLEVVR